MNWTNDITQSVFETLRSQAYSMQLYEIKTSGNFKL